MTKTPTEWSANSSITADLYAYDSADHTYDSAVDSYDGVVAGVSPITTKSPTVYTAVAGENTAWANSSTKNPTPWSNA